MKSWKVNPRRNTADVIAWMPGEGQFCNAPERTPAGSDAVNLWAGFKIYPTPDNWRESVQPFLDHAAFLIPDGDERKRFLQWIAHIFQKPQELPHTHYLMVAAETGTGRGTLASIITRALRGYVAVNVDLSTLWGNFNGRLSQKLLVTVDEVREGLSSGRYEKSEALKSKLTEETRLINQKYGPQFVEKNCCRWLFFSNHFDALPFDSNDRRIIVIENPKQRRAQEEYKALHQLKDNRDFIASVQNYFMTLDLSDFDPFAPAPLNAVKQKALNSLESEEDKAVKEFAATWPGDFATRNDIKEFIGRSDIKDPWLSHAINRAGMKVAGRRVRISGRREGLVIVSPNIEPEDMQQADLASIEEKVLTARESFKRLDSMATVTTQI